MDCDEIVIGSGLSALGVVLGLSASSRVLVICGPRSPLTQFYLPGRTVPCARLGLGGLGSFWHGVIPAFVDPRFEGVGEEDFRTLFAQFYADDVARYYGRPYLFVPWRPVRPARFLSRLQSSRPSLTLVNTRAQHVIPGAAGVEVVTGEGTLSARRVWLCAGALHTPPLIADFPGVTARATVSDHVLCYLGQLHRSALPQDAPLDLRRTRSGMWIRASRHPSGRALVNLRPARFDYRRLDSGIAQRAAFGLPTNSAVGKVLAGASPGLLAEALYNRAGLFPRAGVYSVYAQVHVPDAHWHAGGDNPVRLRSEVICAATDTIRCELPWPGVIPSRRPDMFIPMIHLHHTLDLEALRHAGVNSPESRLQIADASVIEDIGSEHHSFRMMVAAFARARALAA